MEEAVSATIPATTQGIMPSTTGSASAPELRSLQTSSFSRVAPSPLVDAALAQSSSHNGSSDSLSISSDTASYTETIIEALRSKDRLYVLRLGEVIENLINDRRYVLHSCVYRGSTSPDPEHPSWAESVHHVCHQLDCVQLRADKNA